MTGQAQARASVSKRLSPLPRCNVAIASSFIFPQQQPNSKMKRPTALASILSLSLLSGGAASSDIDHDGKAVTCGSAIKLTHVESGGNYYLNSEAAKMGSGSGQQIVSLLPKRNKSSSLWIIREANDDEICPPGEPIKCGQKIRLSHPDTEKNLHSHLVRSPLSRQQEVSGFGEAMEGDTGDDWTVVCGSSSDKVLERAKKFHLQHVDTKRYLAASSEYKFNQSNCGGGCPIMNHLEAHCRSSADKYTEWKVELGVHLSK